MLRPLGAIWVMLSLALAGCSDAPEQSAPVVLAASSLQESLDAAADDWAARGHGRPVLSFAASSTLARQIEAGAKADLFVSADENWMDEIEAKKLIAPDSRAELVANRIVLIAPAAHTQALEVKPGFALRDALGDGLLAMADPDSVPAGRYGRQALESLGVWPDVSARITSGENVRVALALVSRGEVPYGIVYATDAFADPGVQTVGVFPADSHSPVRYPIARLKASGNADAEAFRQYLLSDDGQAIFARFGFEAAR